MQTDWSDLNLISAILRTMLPALLGIVLLADLQICDENRYLTYLMSLGTTIIVTVIQLAVWEQGSVSIFHGMYIVDGTSRLAKLVLYVPMSGLFIYNKPCNQGRRIFKDEFYTLSLFALLDMSVMASTAHLLMAYIGLESLSLSLYAMIALCRDSGRSAGVALRYFVLGALASGSLLYGISIVYGATDSLDFASVLTSAFNEQTNEWLLKLGMVSIVVVIAFKLDAVPFHMWVPDAYNGTPTPIATFVGTASKTTTIVFAFRIFVTDMGTVHSDWAPMLAILVVASLVVDNLAVIMQTDTKRMLAYSTVPYMGFILLAFMTGIVGSTTGLYYAITYALTTAVNFGALMILSAKDIGCGNIKDLTGLNQCHAQFVFLMLLLMFSMAGIPPLMGFYAKFGVIMVLLKQDHVWSSVFAVIISLTGTFYCLRVVKVTYFDAPDHDQPVGSSYAAKLVLAVNTLLLLLWGIMPQTVIDWCAKALENTL